MSKRTGNTTHREPTLSPRAEVKLKGYRYFPHDKIGMGYSSVVYKGVNSQDSTEVAIKAVDLHRIDTEVKRSLLRNEIKLVGVLDH